MTAKMLPESIKRRMEPMIGISVVAHCPAIGSLIIHVEATYCIELCKK
jgi:hypothetical protein